MPRLERDHWVAGAELKDRKVVRLLPQVTLQEMLVAFKEVVVRSEMFSHHHVARERLSVRERMSNILTSLERASFLEFVHLFRPEEGRMGVTVTFIAILELMREGVGGDRAGRAVCADSSALLGREAQPAPRREQRDAGAGGSTPRQWAKPYWKRSWRSAPKPKRARSPMTWDSWTTTSDVAAEEEIEDFGLDEIKVPTVNFGKPDAELAAEPRGERGRR